MMPWRECPIFSPKGKRLTKGEKKQHRNEEGQKKREKTKARIKRKARTRKGREKTNAYQREAYEKKMSAIPKESQIVRRILLQLNSMPLTKAIKMHGSVYACAGTPDILCVCKGVPIFLEVKRIGNKSTEIQKVEQERWKYTGAKVAEVFSVEEAIEFVEKVSRKAMLTEKLKERKALLKNDKIR